MKPAHGRTVLLLALVLVCLPGCRPRLMPTPIIFGADRVDPFVDVQPEDATPEATVFIATTRARRRNFPNGSPFLYVNEREPSGVLRLARATARIGEPGSTWEALRAISLAPARRSSPPLELLAVHEYGGHWMSGSRPDAAYVRSRKPHLQAHAEDPIPELREATDAFLADIDAALARSSRKDIFIYVHGFNTSFAGNTLLAASLWHYLGRQGAMISFAWPSRNNLFSYAQDKASGRAATRNLRLLLLSLNEETDAERIHIVAHSAGSPIVVGALNEIRLMVHQAEPEAIVAKSNIGEVVLAAPDMDVMRFSNALRDGFDQVPERTTIYVSTYDGAIDLSSTINGFARLGNPMQLLEPEHLEILDRSDTISIVDVAEAHRVYHDPLGHSYFVYNPWVSSDLLLTLGLGARPTERGLQRGPEGGIWVFPPDYGTTAPARALELYGASGDPRIRTAQEQSVAARPSPLHDP